MSTLVYDAVTGLLSWDSANAWLVEEVDPGGTVNLITLPPSASPGSLKPQPGYTYRVAGVGDYSSPILVPTASKPDLIEPPAILNPDGSAASVIVTGQWVKVRPAKWRGATGTPTIELFNRNAAGGDLSRGILTGPDYMYQTVTGDAGSQNNEFIWAKEIASNTAGSTDAGTLVVPVRTGATPQPTPSPTPSPSPTPDLALSQLLVNDMTLPSEAMPGFNLDWSRAPVRRNGTPPSNYTSMAAWGCLDGVGGVPQPGKVQIRTVEAWVRSRATGNWTRVQNETGVLAGAFYDSSWTNASIAANQSAAAGGGTAVGSPPAGRNFHFYDHAGRGSISPGDVSALLIAIVARLLPGSFDPASPPKYTMCASADWWINTTAPWKADFSNNRDAGVGRFKRIDGSDRAFTMSNGDLSTLPPLVLPAGSKR